MKEARERRAFLGRQCHPRNGGPLQTYRTASDRTAGLVQDKHGEGSETINRSECFNMLGDRAEIPGLIQQVWGVFRAAF